jgi:hypothetical protein
MKDLIGNTLAVGDKVQVYLPQPHIFGFVAELSEASKLAVRGMAKPGHVLVSCVVALPVDSVSNAVAQVVKVHDSSKAASDPSEGGVGSSQPN